MRVLRRRFSQNAFSVLGLPVDANIEQIESAVASKLKALNFSFDASHPNPRSNDVRRVLEAYALLSTGRTRAYQAAFIPRPPAPDNTLSLETTKAPPLPRYPNLDRNSIDRTKYETAPLAAESALSDVREEHLENLKIAMKRYNFNPIGRYRGGVPNPWSQARGTALGAPGHFHSWQEQRELEGNEDSLDFHVNRIDMVDFFRYKWDDHVNHKTKMTYFRADPKFPDWYAWKWALWLLALVGGSYLSVLLTDWAISKVDYKNMEADDEGIVYRPMAKQEKHAH